MSVRIPRHFNGPPDSANGGYACGVVAAAVDAPAVRVSLRAPPPLEVPLRHDRSGDGSVQLFDGDRLVAEGQPAHLGIEPPPAPSLAAARAAMEGYAGWRHHMFPTCFVCGPERRHDGLCIFPGPLGDDGLVASAWEPEGEGPVDPLLVWSALDCPTAFACSFGGLAVLAALTARLDRPVDAGRPHVVAAWPVARDGRKHTAGAAIYTEDGSPVAVAEALWVEVRDPAVFARA